MFRHPSPRTTAFTCLMLSSSLLLSACSGGNNPPNNLTANSDTTSVTTDTSSGSDSADTGKSDATVNTGNVSTPADNASTNTGTGSTTTDTATGTDTTTQPAEPPRITNARGALLGGQLINTNSVEASTEAASDPTSKVPAVIPQYAVNHYRVTYQTMDSTGQLIEASGLVAVPQKPAGAKSPLLSFQHGTIFHDREAPSNETVAASPANIVASLGYVVIAADYVGYGASRGKPHPYLQAKPSAIAVADFLTAARQWLTDQKIPVNNQLFLTGYSEGGYVTLAAQQALESDNIPITASVAGAGPYDLKYTLDELYDGLLDTLYTKLTSFSFRPGYAAKYPGKFDEMLVDALLEQITPDDSDIVFDKTFLMDWMADDDATMAANSVHDWLAKTPTRLTHGRDDETVPFGNATIALDAMRKRGTQDIDLVECTVTPSNHSNCIKPYAQFMAEYFGQFATDL